MKKLLIVGNWKMNITIAEAEKYREKFSELLTANKTKIAKTTNYGLAVPFLAYNAFNKFFPASSGNFLAAQNMHYLDSGAVTGEISPLMLKSAGFSAVIIGHSERRQYFQETDEIAAKKVKAALSHKLLPILCIGETLEEFNDRKTKRVVKRQLEVALTNLTEEEKAQVVIAYEPIWAIGTGKTATAAQAEVVCKYIRSLVTSKSIILYGGSVNPENIESLMAEENIDGALVGGASLKPESFCKLLTLNK